ncbi:conserved hypothetical protein [uncultured Thiomicrorhabdus sp.]
MVENYQDLYQLIQQASVLYQQKNPSKSFEVTQQENGSCSWAEQTSGKKFVFMLAKLGDELKIGYAYFEPNEQQPDWIDDVLASVVTAESVCQLVDYDFS